MRSMGPHTACRAMGACRSTSQHRVQHTAHRACAPQSSMHDVTLHSCTTACTMTGLRPKAATPGAALAAAHAQPRGRCLDRQARRDALHGSCSTAAGVTGGCMTVAMSEQRQHEGHCGLE